MCETSFNWTSKIVAAKYKNNDLSIDYGPLHLQQQNACTCIKHLKMCKWRQLRANGSALQLALNFPISNFGHRLNMHVFHFAGSPFRNIGIKWVQKHWCNLYRWIGTRLTIFCLKSTLFQNVETSVLHHCVVILF